MADNFDDKNLFGDSFDLFKSDSSNLFGQNNMANKNNIKANNVTNNTPKTDFSFDDNLFGDDLFDNSDLNKNLNSTKTNQSPIKSEQKSNLDFGFDDNNLFGDTALPKSEPKQDIPTNLFDTPSDLFGNEKQEKEKLEGAQEFKESEDVAQSQSLENEEIIQQDTQEETTASENKSSKKKTNKKGKKNKKETEESTEESLEELQEDSKTIIPESKDELEPISEVIAEDEKKSYKAESKKFFRKHKKLIIILSSVLFAIIIGVVLFVLLTGETGEKLLTPEFNVYQRESGTVLIVEKQENAQGYEIVISQTGKPDVVFSSKENTIELRLYLNEPGIFNIKVRVLGNSPKNHSDLSNSKQIANYVKLDTPQLFKDGKIISWNNVNNAVAYKLYYKANVQEDVVDFIEIPADKSQYTFDLTQLEQYGAGLYPICVEAIASGEFLLNSDYSETINFEYCSELDKPMAVVFDSETKMLSFVTVKNRTQASKYLIVVSLANGTVLTNHYIYTNEIEKQDLTYQGAESILYTASLSELLSSEPVSITIKAQGDGIYTFDSDVVDALII